MNNTCPNCGKGYNLQPHHVGRRISCKNCGASLVVESDGLRLDPGAATSTAPPDVPAFAEQGGGPTDFDDDPGGRLSPARRRLAGRSFNPNELMGALPGWLDVSLTGFGLGVVLILAFTLFPLIDSTKVKGLAFEIRHGESLHQRKVAELRKAKDFKAEHVEEETKRWEKEKEELETRRLRAEASGISWQYWYSWGLLFGFIVLSISSLGFLRSEVSLIRRIVGSVVLVALVLLIFYLFAFR